MDNFPVIWHRLLPYCMKINNFITRTRKLTLELYQSLINIFGLFRTLELNECASNPCQHDNATCIDNLNGYVCNCPANITGVHCDNGNILFLILLFSYLHLMITYP